MTENLGVINEINGYVAKIIINKDEAPNPIYPLKDPMPIYIKDSEGNHYLIYEQRLVAPSSDLPSWTVMTSSGPVVIDPAKNFILQSALSNFQGSATLITEDGIPQLLSDVFKINNDDLLTLLQEYGFKHLKLVADIIGTEKFKIFMRVYAKSFSSIIKSNESIRKDILQELVEIGNIMKLNDSLDYLNILEEFMSENAVSVALENKMESVKVLLKDQTLKYGDLISFREDERITLAVIKDLGGVSSLDLLFAIERDIPTTFVRPLKMGMQGVIEGVEEIIENLNSQLDDSFIKIPIAVIPSTNQTYSLIFKGNELIHFAIISISGKGKGNVLKEMIFNYQKGLINHYLENGNLNEWAPLGIILFDDAGEYVKCLKPRDWGINLGMAVLRFLQGENDIPPQIHLIDIARGIEQNDSIEEEYRFIDVQTRKIPLEYIPLEEILRKLEGAKAYGLIIRYLRHFYTEISPGARPPEFNGYRMCLEFINWFINENNHQFNSRGRDQFNYAQVSYDTAKREVINFLLNNHNYLGLQFNFREEQFSYILDRDNNPIIQTINNDKGNPVRTTLINDYNLLHLAMNCADHGETLIIDESSLDPDVKLLIQRILLSHIVETREDRGFEPNITPCLFIIEEATALMGGKGAKQISLFGKMQVRARKFGVGIGLVLQDINRLDPSLLTQLGWMIALGLPVKSMRSVLFRNVPADLGSFDDYVKYADKGVAIGFQQLIGNNLPLPIKISHYEKEVKDTLWLKEYWGEGGFDEESQNNFREIATHLDIPQEVINEILRHEEEDDEVDEND